MMRTGRVLPMECSGADGLAPEILNNGIQLRQRRREFASLRCRSPRVARALEPRKYQTGRARRKHHHGMDGNHERAGQTRRSGTERPVVGAASDAGVLRVLLCHSDEPRARESIGSFRWARQIERVDVLVGLVELRDQRIGDGAAPLRDCRERDVAAAIVDVERCIGCENAVQQTGAIFILGMKVVSQDDFGRKQGGRGHGASGMMEIHAAWSYSMIPIGFWQA